MSSHPSQLSCLDDDQPQASLEVVKYEDGHRSHSNSDSLPALDQSPSYNRELVHPPTENNNHPSMEDNCHSNTEDNGHSNMAGSHRPNLANNQNFAQVGTQHFCLCLNYVRYGYHNGPSRNGNAHQPVLPMVVTIAAIASLVVSLVVGSLILYKHVSPVGLARVHLNQAALRDNFRDTQDSDASVVGWAVAWMGLLGYLI